MSKHMKKMGKADEKEEGANGGGEGFFGGLFKGIGTLVDLAEKLEKEGGVIRKQGEISGLGKKLSSLDQLKHLAGRRDIKGVYGFTIRTGLGERGGPRVESFGNVRKTAHGPEIGEKREPIVDIFEEKDRLRIIVEMPGVEERTVKTTLKGKTLTVDAGAKDLRYHKEISLPCPVDPAKKKVSYKNGVLNIEFPF